MATRLVDDKTAVYDAETSYRPISIAEVAELADAPDSKSGSRKGVGVRLPPSAVALYLTEVARGARG